MKLYSMMATATAILFGLVYSIASAQEEGGGKAAEIELKGEKQNRFERKGPKKGKRGIHRSFDKLDENNDGFLSFTEFTTSERLAKLGTEKRRALFNFLDRNKDGKVQRSELGPRHSERVETLRNNFKSLDVDQNNQLSFDEFTNDGAMLDKGTDERRTIFKHLDRNRDGVIVLDELKKDPRPKMRMALDFKKNDKDESGTLDYSEYRTLPFVSKFDELRKRKHFEHMDTDADGEISLKEIYSAHKHGPHRSGGPMGRPRSANPGDRGRGPKGPNGFDRKPNNKDRERP